MTAPLFIFLRFCLDKGTMHLYSGECNFSCPCLPGGGKEAYI